MKPFNRMSAGAKENDISFDSKISKILELVKAVKEKHSELEKQNTESNKNNKEIVDVLKKEIDSLKEKLVVAEEDNKKLSTNLSSKTDYDDVKSNLADLDKKCSVKDDEIKALNAENKKLIDLIEKIKTEFKQVHSETTDVSNLLTKYNSSTSQEVNDPFKEEQKGGDEIDDILNFTETY